MVTPTGTAVTEYTPELAGRLHSFVTRAAALPDVKEAVEANHDDNRWWPIHVQDWRMRMAVAGWSTRVSYAMIGTYVGVVTQANTLGWRKLTTLNDESLTRLVRPIGLAAARVRYLRSLASFINRSGMSRISLATTAPDDLIASLAAGVGGAGYKTAQCAVLYARGYHCGVIPVDAGMVTKLAPLLGIYLTSGAVAHEQMRKLIQHGVTIYADAYRDLVHTSATRSPYRPVRCRPGLRTWYSSTSNGSTSTGPGQNYARAAPPVPPSSGAAAGHEDPAVNRLGVIGNISRDLAVYPDGRRFELLGGAALHVARAAARAGLAAAPVSVIGTDLAWIRTDPRLAGLDLTNVNVVPGRSCAFTLTYTAAGNLARTGCSFGAAESLTRHCLTVIGHHDQLPRVLPPAPRRPSHSHPPDPRRAACSVDFHLASARDMISATVPFLPQATVVFVNAAEFADPASAHGPWPASSDRCVQRSPRSQVLRYGQVTATVRPPATPEVEVTGAGDTLAGAFLAYTSSGADEAMRCEQLLAQRHGRSGTWPGDQRVL